MSPQIKVLVVDRKLEIIPSGGAFDDDASAALYRMLPALRWTRALRWEMPYTRGSVMRLIEAVPVLANVGVDVRTQPGLLRITPRPPASLDDLPFPTPTKPWKHQKEAHWFLVWARRRLRAALLDCGMRTGKSLMVLNHLAALEPDLRRALVVTPHTAVPVWVEQNAKHVEKKRLRIVGLDDGTVAARVAKVIDLLTGSRPTIAVIGWPVLERLNLKQKKALRGALASASVTLVADEVHKIKSPGSSRSKAFAYIADGAPFVIGASGTLLSHSPLDAYGIFRTIDPGIWGSNNGRFKDTYSSGGYDPRTQKVLGPLRYKNLDELARLMAPYVYYASREVLDLPPAQDIDVPVRLPPAAAKIYAELRDDMVTSLKSGVMTVPNQLAKLIRLAQVASGYLPAQDGSGREEILHDVKQAALLDLLESCDPLEPWVTMSLFTHDLGVTARAAKDAGRACYELSGRINQLAEWRAACKRGKGAVLAVQLASGSEAIGLDEACFCAYLSIGYSLSQYKQSKTRIHSSEQTRPVAYYHLIARGTVDRLIRAALTKNSDILAFVTAEIVKAQREELA